MGRVRQAGLTGRAAGRPDVHQGGPAVQHAHEFVQELEKLQDNVPAFDSAAACESWRPPSARPCWRRSTSALNTPSAKPCLEKL